MLFDQPERLEPDEVLNWRALCTSGLERERANVCTCLLGSSPIPAYLVDALQGATSNGVDSYFTSCNQELDLSAVLTLIAAAEARIRLDAKRRTQASAGTNVLTGRLSLLFSMAGDDRAVPLYERGIMEAWKDYTATLSAISAQDQDRIRTCIGGLKDVLRVRHWVAHGRYWELRGGIGRYPPANVGKVVTSLYKALREAATCGGLMTFR